MTRVLLFVEPDQEFRRQTVARLGSSGLEIVECACAAEADALLPGRKVEIIVLSDSLADAQSPEWLCQTRRSLPEAKVVFLVQTKIDDRTLVRLKSDLNVDLIVYKPVLPQAFANQVLGLVGRDDQSGGSVAGQELEEIFRSLADEYRQALPGLLEQLRQAVSAAHANPSDPGLIQAAIERAHTLKGTAGSYGLAELSRQFGAIETGLRLAGESAVAQRRSIFSQIEVDLDAVSLT